MTAVFGIYYTTPLQLLLLVYIAVAATVATFAVHVIFYYYICLWGWIWRSRELIPGVYLLYVRVLGKHHGSDCLASVELKRFCDRSTI